MKIETKYSIGDEVWIMWKKKIYCVPIEAITVEAFCSKVVIRYDMVVPNACISCREYAVYSTKEELLKSL